jgi:hypothetical protein
MNDRSDAAEPPEPFHADGGDGDSRPPAVEPLGRESEGDDARVVMDFGVGPSGVGPAVGVGSGDFFPVVSDSEAGTSHDDLP